MKELPVRTAFQMMALLLTLAIPLATCSDTSGTSTVLNQDSIVADNDSNTTSATATGAFANNPTVALPEHIASSIHDDATFITTDTVMTTDGRTLDASTGKPVSADSDLVGATQSAPDPLAKTDGDHFIPETVKSVRTQIKSRTDAETTAAISATGGTGSSSTW